MTLWPTWITKLCTGSPSLLFEECYVILWEHWYACRQRNQKNLENRIKSSRKLAISSLMCSYLSVKMLGNLEQNWANYSHFKMTRFADLLLSYNNWEGWQQPICKLPSRVTLTPNYTFLAQCFEKPSPSHDSTMIRLSSCLILTSLSLPVPRISHLFIHDLSK